jgi:hypothetical protein
MRGRCGRSKTGRARRRRVLLAGMEVWEEGCGKGFTVFCAKACMSRGMEMDTRTQWGGGGLLGDSTKEATPMGWDCLEDML